MPVAPLVPWPVQEPLWQESQRLALTAEWFIVYVVKLGAVLVWQLLHWTAVTGICGGVVSPVADVPLWQLEQLVSVAEWVNVPPAQLVKPDAALA